MKKENKTVLHLANDYAGSKVYKNLIKELDDLGVAQIIYCPIRNANLMGGNKINLKEKNSRIIYSPILNNYSDRVFFKIKITKIVKDLESKIDIDYVSLIHAHTWFSDGGVAYELFKKYRLPYIVTVRNTDLNLFFKYMIHLRSYGLEILQNATKIIFISAVYKKRFFEINLFNENRFDFEKKAFVVPNGVDDFWIQNKQNKKKILKSPIELVYVGNFSNNKNVLTLINAVNRLNKIAVEFHLTLIGGGGRNEGKVKELIKLNSSIKFLGKIDDKNKMLEIFRRSDIFTMPSHSETFGLVYIEAISQSLPIVYTKNEGIDGFYNDMNIGEAVDSRKIETIMNGIDKIRRNYNNYNIETVAILKNHDWLSIAKKYEMFYKSMK